MSGRRERLPECVRSPHGKHEIVSGAVAEYCRFCWVVPRYLSDEIGEPAIQKGQPGAQRTTRAGQPMASDKGHLPKRDALIERDGLSCFYCEHELLDPRLSSHPDALWWPTIDHLLPRVAGGKNSLDNLVLACKSCNLLKGEHVRLLAEVIVRLRRKVSDAQEAEARCHEFIERLQWELFDAGIGEIPGRTKVDKRRRPPTFKRPRGAIRDVALIVEIGERACANLRAENTGQRHARTASVVKRGRLLKRREAVLS